MKNNDQAEKLAKLFTQWINECTATHSFCTIKSYKISLTSFLTFLEQRKDIKSTGFFSRDMLNTDSINYWLDWLMNEKKCSSQTCNVRLANLRSFIKYVANRDSTFRDIYIGINTIRQRKTIKKPVQGMSKKAVKTLLATPDTHTYTGFRDVVLLSLLYATGMRIQELISIQIKDLNLDVEYPYVIVLGKGSKIRTLSLPPKVVNMLKKYIRVSFPYGSNLDDFLFYSKIRGKNHPISQMGVSKRIKLYAADANKKCCEVPTDLHAHQLRHARATHWLDDGLNIAQVSKLLGHENIETTMIYLDITEEIKSKAIKARMNDEIKNVKPKWNKRKVKSLLSIFGLE